MFELLLRFVGLLSAGLAAGIAVSVFLMERAWAGGTGQFYTQLMQLLNRALTVPAPALGAVGLVAIAIDSALQWKRGGGTPAWLGIGAVALALTAMLVTKLGHFPINDQMMKWDPASPPADWMTVRAKWSSLHVVRTAVAVGSFSLFVLGNVVRK